MRTGLDAGPTAAAVAPARPGGAADLFIVAGEASGDLHGGTLARALLDVHPRLRLAGMGGPRMRAAGVVLRHGIEHAAVVGGTEVLGRLPALLRSYRDLAHRLATERPRALVLVDFPDFNLRLARVARRLDIPAVYFLAPQVWAWRRYRLRAMARDLARVLAVFPFEVALYREAGVPVEWVGHPLLDVLPALDPAEARRELAGNGELLIGLLPGSRREEVRRLLPELLRAARRILARLPHARFALPRASTIDQAAVAPAVAASGVPVAVLPDGAHRVMAGADLLLVASGTAALEAACYRTPMVVVYRLSSVSYALARLFVRGVRHISLPNILAGREVVPELIQGRAVAAAIAETALGLLADPARRAAQRAELAEVRGGLGEPGAAARAARAVLDLMDGPAAAERPPARGHDRG